MVLGIANNIKFLLFEIKYNVVTTYGGVQRSKSANEYGVLQEELSQMEDERR